MTIGSVFKHAGLTPDLLERFYQTKTFEELSVQDRGLIYLHIRGAQGLAKMDEKIKPSNIILVKGTRDSSLFFRSDQGESVSPDVVGRFARIIFNFNAIENYSLRNSKEGTVYTLEDGEFILYLIDTSLETSLKINKDPKREIRSANGHVRYHIRPRNYLRYTMIVDFGIDPTQFEGNPAATDTSTDQKPELN